MSNPVVDIPVDSPVVDNPAVGSPAVGSPVAVVDSPVVAADSPVVVVDSPEAGPAVGSSVVGNLGEGIRQIAGNSWLAGDKGLPGGRQIVDTR